MNNKNPNLKSVTEVSAHGG